MLAAAGAYGMVKGWGRGACFAWLAGSAVAGLVTAFLPSLLTPFNKAWFLLGQVLGKLVSPIVLGVIFFGVLTPVAFVLRVLGRDELRVKRQPVASYWIDRVPPGPAGDSFKNQF